MFAEQLRSVTGRFGEVFSGAVGRGRWVRGGDGRGVDVCIPESSNDEWVHLARW